MADSNTIWTSYFDIDDDRVTLQADDRSEIYDCPGPGFEVRVTVPGKDWYLGSKRFKAETLTEAFEIYEREKANK